MYSEEAIAKQVSAAGSEVIDMDAKQYEESASRWVTGERLAPDEEQDLLDWLESHPDAREALLEDESLDSLLAAGAGWMRRRKILWRAACPGVGRAIAVVEAPPVIAPPRVARSELQAKGVLSRKSRPSPEAQDVPPRKFSRLQALSRQSNPLGGGDCQLLRGVGAGRHRMAVARRRPTCSPRKPGRKPRTKWPGSAA